MVEIVKKNKVVWRERNNNRNPIIVISARQTAEEYEQER
jgi:hypothetical protein